MRLVAPNAFVNPEILLPGKTFHYACIIPYSINTCIRNNELLSYSPYTFVVCVMYKCIYRTAATLCPPCYMHEGGMHARSICAFPLVPGVHTLPEYLCNHCYCDGRSHENDPLPSGRRSARTWDKRAVLLSLSEWLFPLRPQIRIRIIPKSFTFYLAQVKIPLYNI